MPKVFADRPLRQPKGIESHPAHARAASAFGPEALAAAAAAARKAEEEERRQRRRIRVARRPAAHGFRLLAVVATSRTPKPRPGASSPTAPPAVPVSAPMTVGTLPIDPPFVRVEQPSAPATLPPARRVDLFVAAEARIAPPHRLSSLEEAISLRQKQTAHPSIGARERLRAIRRRSKIAEAFVGELALERYFAAHTNDQIADRLRRLGHGLRRAPGSGPIGAPLTLYIRDEERARLEMLYDHFKLASSIVAGDALDWLFAGATDEHIATALSALGFGLKRPRMGEAAIPTH